jgi:hypothetical protein
MQQRRFPIGLALAALGIIVLASAGLAQPQLADLGALKEQIGKSRAQFSLMALGQKPVTAADQDLLDAFAKWYVHRLTDGALRQDQTNYSKKASALIDEFEREVINPIHGPNVAKGGNQPFLDRMGPAFVKSMRPMFQDDVLEGDNRMVQVTAAKMLPRIATLKQADIGLYLAELLKDATKHDAIRMYAAQGLKEFFPPRAFTDIDIGFTKHELLRDREVPLVEALAGYIDGTTGPKPGMADDEAIRYLRRQALESLALVQVPAVSTIKRDGKPRGAAAPVMLKVLTKKSLKPEPGLHEKIEAAIGLCQLKYLNVHEYRGDLAVYAVGRFIDEFAQEYNKQWANLKPGPTHKPATVHWKIEAKRLELAVKELAANAKDNPIQPHAAEQNRTYKNAQVVQYDALPILKDIYEERQAPQASLVTMRDHVKVMRPSIKTPFRKLESPDIELD